jgi:iron-sulfur cluster repair protein YtfE (RIC family)
MEIESLAAALEREHHEIDEGIDAFVADPSAESGRQPLRQAIRALRRHIYLEEEFLFPPLREAGLVAPIFVMLREHGQMWNTLDVLERELETGATPATVLTLCRQLMVQLQHHNPKEERVLYPQADHVLSAPATARLREFLDQGELPAGWVCAKAETRTQR